MPIYPVRRTMPQGQFYEVERKVIDAISVVVDLLLDQDYLGDLQTMLVGEENSAKRKLYQSEMVELETALRTIQDELFSEDDDSANAG